MTAERTLQHAPALQAGKEASKALVRAAGGGEAAEGYCSKSQPRLSAYGLPNTPDFMPIDVVRDLEAITHGGAGHPIVTRWLAKEAGYLLVERPKPGLGGSWGRSLQDLGREFGEVSGSVCGALGDPDTPGAVTAAEVRDHRIVENLDELAELVARMRAMAVHVLESGQQG